MIYSIDEKRYVDSGNFVSHKGDPQTGIDDEVEGPGELIYVPDYYDEFTARFLRRFGMTEKFQKLFPDIREVDSYEALELLT